MKNNNSLWIEFYTIIQELNKKDCDPRKFEADAKGWVIVYSLQSTKEKISFTPYMHTFAMYVPEFFSPSESWKYLHLFTARAGKTQ